MNYASELKKFVTGQYIYSGVRISLAVVIPCIVLAQMGLLREYFLFPLGTVFLALIDMPGPFHRRRNALLFGIVCYFLVSLLAGLLKDFPLLIILELVILGLSFTMLGVYGQRLAAVGSLTLVVLAIFIDGAPGEKNFFWNSLTFTLGAVWFLGVFMVVTVLKPYKLAAQMIGENYIDLGNYLKLKARFFHKDTDIEVLYQELIALQVKIKEHQEATREMVFKTRQIVKESTSTSRLLMQLFLNSLDLYEQLLTSTNDYRKLQNNFGHTLILERINSYLHRLSQEMVHLGISIQGGLKAVPIMNISEELQELHEEYFELRNKELNPESLEQFLILRQILYRISEVSEEIKKLYLLKSQNLILAKSLSSGLDLQKFVPHEEKINPKVLLENFSLKSNHFRHAIRITIALLMGYAISKLPFLHVEKTFWILITILAIMRPAYSITKKRNTLRLYGTFFGALAGLVVIYYINSEILQFIIFLICLTLTFSLLKDKYAWSVFFMTIYIFQMFHFMKPGPFEDIFLERLYDTVLAGIIVFGVSKLVLPVWEHEKNRDLMLKYMLANRKYFDIILELLSQKNVETQVYKMNRKEAVVTLANLSDNFQRMLSDPKDQQKNLELVHQFVNTSHLFTAYTASLSQYAQQFKMYLEIDFPSWKNKIDQEISNTLAMLRGEVTEKSQDLSPEITADDLVNEMLQKRKGEMAEQEVYNQRDPKKISYLTEVKNIQELLELIYNEAREQGKIVRKISDYSSESRASSTTAK